MTENGKTVQWHPMTSGKTELLETVAKRYRYEGGVRAIRRPAEAGRLADVRHDPATKTWYFTEFRDQGIVAILPSGDPKFRLPIGTTAVVPVTLPNSPVSGLAFVSRVHAGALPWVKLHVDCSGISTILHLAMETDGPPDSSPVSVPSRSAPTLSVRPRPQACPHCHKRTVGWDEALRSWWCHSCAWSETII